MITPPKDTNMNDIKKTLLSLMGTCSTFVLLAQPPAPPATPIDGGLGLLLLGGAAYGIKKVYEKKIKS